MDAGPSLSISRQQSDAPSMKTASSVPASHSPGSERPGGEGEAAATNQQLEEDDVQQGPAAHSGMPL